MALWTSDLARARETAAYVEAAGGLTAVVDPRLREYDLGERTGMTMPEYAASFPDEYAAFRQGRYEVVPGGESTATVTARVTAVLREALAALAPGECGVVVSHGGALKVSLVEVLGWPSGLAATVRGLDNCGWAELEDTGAGGALRLAAYNRVAGPRRSRDLLDPGFRAAGGRWLRFRELPGRAGTRWGCGAAGSASAWHAEGQGFESPQLHRKAGPPGDRPFFVRDGTGPYVGSSGAAVDARW